MDSVFAGRMMFEAGLRCLTKAGTPLFADTMRLCIGSGILENFEKKYKAGGGVGGRVQLPICKRNYRRFTIDHTTYLRHATLSGNSGSPYIFNTPPHSAITVHHIS